MPSNCPICHESKEQLLCLPCHPQHKACRDCLELNLIETGKALKCHECRRVFGWINLDLLQVEGGNAPDEQKCYMCFQEGVASDAKVYCKNCYQLLCESCEQSHKKLFRGSAGHCIVPFDEYRAHSEKYRNSVCQRERHNQGDIIVICTKCNGIGCVVCFSSPEECPQGENTGDKHKFKPLNDGDAREKLKTLCSDLKKKIKRHDEDLKLLLATMEIYRCESEGFKDKSIQTLEAKIKAMQNEQIVLAAQLDDLLQQKAGMVTAQKERYNQAILQLQSMLDGVTAVLNSSNAVKLLQSEGDIVEQVQEHLAAVIEPLQWILPKLIITGSHNDNLLGMKVSVVQRPSAIEYLERVAGTGQACYTVTLSDDGHLHHGGEYYSTLGIVFPNSKNRVICMRKTSNDKILALVEDYQQGKAYIGAYGCELAEDGKESYKELKRANVTYTGTNTVQFAKIQNLMYHTTWGNNKIQKYDAETGSSAGEWLPHPLMSYTNKICTSEDGQIYVSTNGQYVFSFPSSELNGEIRGITVINCGQGVSPTAIAFHKQCLYALCSNKQLLVFHKGKLETTLQLPQLGGNNFDMSINETGQLAVADYAKGVQKYQLIF